MKTLQTDKAPAAVGPYSQAIVTNHLVFVSGQIGILPQTGELAEGLAAQTEQAIKNVGEILRAAGLDYGNVVKTTCFLSDIGDFSAFNDIYEKYFIGRPARSLIQAAALPKGALVEVEAIAER
ncbi:MAG: RidA family protein [Christensenellales bacterium]|jgi:2-iminobutanoate/2-iminopropanoate deaminase